MKAKATKIADDVYFVGTLDWDIRKHHGCTLPGTTYNAFLIFCGEKAVLIDNVSPGYSAQMWGRIEDAFKSRQKEVKIDYIIQNLVAKDHSGALSQIHQRFPQAPIYCTQIAKPSLIKHYPDLSNAHFVTVESGDKLEVANKTFTFVDAKMIHWPDSMFTFLEEDEILFSNDAFGQHLCKMDRFDSDIPESELMDAAQKFYANFLTPLTPFMTMKLDEVTKEGLFDNVAIIAPSHGQVWTDASKIVEAYKNWAAGICQRPQATLIYDTMHNSTQMMAHAIAEGLMSEGVDVKMHYLKEDERSEIAKDMLESKAILMGVPTLFNNVYPSIGDILLYTSELEFSRTGKRFAATFGSYGWGGNGHKWLNDVLKEAGFDVVENLEINYVPDEEDLEKCFEMGVTIANKVNEMFK